MRACLGVAASLVIAMGVASAQAKVTKLEITSKQP